MDMKKPLILLLALFALAMPRTSAAQAPAEWRQGAAAHPLYAELVAMAATETDAQVQGHVAGQLRTQLDISALQALAVFLSNKSYGQKQTEKLNIGYYLLYSDTMLAIPPLTRSSREQYEAFQHAISSAFIFEALAMLDGARCTDPTLWPKYKSQVLSERLGRLANAYGAYDYESYLRMLDAVQDYVSKLQARPPNVEICGMGSERSPERMFVDPYTWTDRMEAVNQALKEFWVQRYENAAKASAERAAVEAAEKKQPAP